MATDEGMGTYIGFALVVRFRTRPRRPLDPSLDFSARAWAHLLHRVFLTGFSNSWIDWAARNSPASEYLQALSERFGHASYWYAPTLLWLSSGSHTLTGLCWAGMIASLLLALNIWPRGMLAICFVCFLSFVSAAQDFSAYQSDGMLLEAGFLAMFLAPDGFRPGWGEESRPSRASHFLLVWECFRIYFESGVAKIIGGDPQWRNFTALDEYYQNGPLPTWIGWHMQHFPHWFHAVTSFGTLALELALAWMMFLSRRIQSCASSS